MKYSCFSRPVLLYLIFCLVSACDGQSHANIKNSAARTKADKIEEILSLYAEYGGFNGAALVAHEGEVIYKKGIGFANMEWDIPNQPDTKFQIASLTKSFTAMLTLQLVAEKKLELYKPISHYLPDYPKFSGDKITIHHLLTHSSGIPNANNGVKKFRPNEMVDQFANEPLAFAPGERFGYSNSGYTLLGYLIETITGKSYAEVLQDKILTPLSMTSTGFYQHRPLIKNMASGYNKGFGDFFNIDYSDESSAYAAGGIYSTVEDLFVWDQALYSERLLPGKHLDLIFSKHIPDPEFGGHYGYGWELIDRKLGNTNSQIATISHGGSINGYRSSLKRIPSSQSSIALLSNTSYAFLNAISTAILGILYDKPYDFPLKPLALFMSRVVEKEGIDKGILFYQEHKDSDEYYVSEQELIVAGYRMLHVGKAEEAAKVFKLSIEIFPDRDNPYDSYAEALMTLGKNEEAIKNYKKSLNLNPNNKNAKRMIEKLLEVEPK